MYNTKAVWWQKPLEKELENVNLAGTTLMSRFHVGYEIELPLGNLVYQMVHVIPQHDMVSSLCK